MIKYIMCNKCGKKLGRAESGTIVELEFPKCGKLISVVVGDEDMRISDKPLPPEGRQSAAG